MGIWKREKGEDGEAIQEKRALTPGEILNVFKHISSQDLYDFVSTKTMPDQTG